MTKALYNILEFLARKAHSLFFFNVLEISGTPTYFFFYYVAPMAANTWKVTRIDRPDRRSVGRASLKGAVTIPGQSNAERELAAQTRCANSMRKLAATSDERVT